MFATCAYGLKVNSFAEPNNQFYMNGIIANDFDSLGASARYLTVMKLPTIARLLNIRITVKSIEKYFRDIILDTMSVRKEKNIVRNDMINTMMQVRDGTLSASEAKTDQNDGSATVEESVVGKANEKYAWNDQEIVANAFVFYVAGG